MPFASRQLLAHEREPRARLILRILKNTSQPRIDSRSQPISERAVVQLAAFDKIAHAGRTDAR